jgi:hypothetical protein
VRLVVVIVPVLDIEILELGEIVKDPPLGLLL